MKASELIKRLQLIHDLVGDLEVCMLTENPLAPGGGGSCFERAPKVDVVDMPDVNADGENETVLVIAWPELLPGEDPFEADPPAPSPRPSLSLVK